MVDLNRSWLILVPVQGLYVHIIVFWPRCCISVQSAYPYAMAPLDVWWWLPVQLHVGHSPGIWARWLLSASVLWQGQTLLNFSELSSLYHPSCASLPVAFCAAVGHPGTCSCPLLSTQWSCSLLHVAQVQKLCVFIRPHVLGLALLCNSQWASHLAPLFLFVFACSIDELLFLIDCHECMVLGYCISCQRSSIHWGMLFPPFPTFSVPVEFVLW